MKLKIKIRAKKQPEENFQAVSSGYQKDIKALKCRMLAFMLIFVLFNVFLTCTIKNEENVSSENTVTTEAATQKVVNQTKFKSILNEIINDISVKVNVQYALEERYYDEYSIISYISIMSDMSADKITEKEIKSYFWEIFMPVETADGVRLIKKDNKTLVLECPEQQKMNKLDYALMGTVNNEVIKLSKGFYISQNDEKFEKMAYGSSNVKVAGCGIVSLTMALNYVSEKEIVKLEDVLKWAQENNMYIDGVGSSWSLISGFAKTVPVNCEQIYINSLESFCSSLEEGEVYIASMGKGNFTQSGHFIVITKTEDAKVSVLDPASICRSLKKWDAQTVFEQSNKCFWKISA